MSTVHGVHSTFFYCTVCGPDVAQMRVEWRLIPLQVDTSPSGQHVIYLNGSTAQDDHVEYTVPTHAGADPRTASAPPLVFTVYSSYSSLHLFALLARSRPDVARM